MVPAYFFTEGRIGDMLIISHIIVISYYHSYFYIKFNFSKK